jgi:hypothetical protein
MKRSQLRGVVQTALNAQTSDPTSALHNIKAIFDDGSQQADAAMEAELGGDPTVGPPAPIGAVVRISPILISRLNNLSARRAVEDCVFCVSLRCEPSVVASGAVVPDNGVDAIIRAVLAPCPESIRVSDGEVITKLLDEKGLYSVGVFFTASIVTA